MREKDLRSLQMAIKEFKSNYPHLADNPWPTLCKVAQWAASRKKRPGSVPFVVRTMVGWAWSNGALPELDAARARDEDIESKICAALQVEHDPRWRDRLMNAEGIRTRREVLEQWEKSSSFR
jgi:hypothetical protein